MRVLRQIFFLVLLGACRGGDAATPKAAPAAPAPAAAPPVDTASASGSAEEAAVVPVAVAGAYLAGCSTDTGTSYVKDSDRAESIAACVVTDEHAAAVAVEKVSARVTLNDGTTLTPAVVPKEVSSAWAIGVDLGLQHVDQVARIDLAFDVGGVSATAGTDSLDYQWTKDPLFNNVIATFQSIAAILEDDAEVTFDKTGEIAEATAKDGAQIAFVTAKLFAGDFAGKADAACQEAGAKLDPARSWAAVFSTSKLDARDKVAVTRPVYTVSGRMMAGAASFWNTIDASVRFDETLKATSQALPGSDPPRFNDHVWAATVPGGTYDAAAGACEDWTSAASTVNGGIWTALSVRFFRSENHLRPCSRLARLFCLSL